MKKVTDKTGEKAFSIKRKSFSIFEHAGIPVLFFFPYLKGEGGGGEVPPSPPFRHEEKSFPIPVPAEEKSGGASGAGERYFP
ncbi:hypothetical protein [Mailhella massiliensis]|uniref:hypothetical protein n=1 Tax=Mailhella massiliensis TaxID=1903261 RepID=UPI001184924C|nr:hypothetical protein [Mailhella massiliensis]